MLFGRPSPQSPASHWRTRPRLPLAGPFRDPARRRALGWFDPAPAPCTPAPGPNARPPLGRQWPHYSLWCASLVGGGFVLVQAVRGWGLILAAVNPPLALAACLAALVLARLNRTATVRAGAGPLAPAALALAALALLPPRGAWRVGPTRAAALSWAGLAPWPWFAAQLGLAGALRAEAGPALYPCRAPWALPPRGLALRLVDRGLWLRLAPLHFRVGGCLAAGRLCPAPRGPGVVAHSPLGQLCCGPAYWGPLAQACLRRRAGARTLRHRTLLATGAAGHGAWWGVPATAALPPLHGGRHLALARPGAALVRAAWRTGQPRVVYVHAPEPSVRVWAEVYACGWDAAQWRLLVRDPQLFESEILVFREDVVEGLKRRYATEIFRRHVNRLYTRPNADMATHEKPNWAATRRRGPVRTGALWCPNVA